jgi:hypothetical protein
MDQAINRLFTFSESFPVNDNFETMGYESCNSLQNLDTILLFLIGIAVMFVITPIVETCLKYGN